VANPPRQTAQAGSQDSGCGNTAAAAVVGGIVGALVSKNQRGQGAAVGAALAAIACLAIDAQSRQTSTGAAVLQDYQGRHGGQTPAAPVLEGYRSATAATASRGGSQVIQSTGQLVVPPGAASQARFSEVLELTIPGESAPKTSRKDIAVKGGGGFQQTFTMPLATELPQGTYRYVTRVIGADNRVMGEQSGQFQVI
jgi:hypothetical protein